MLNLKIILRSLRRNLIYTWTNVIGLAIAFCFIFLTSIYLIHEYTFDQSYPDSAKIHRLVTTNSASSRSANSSSYPYILSSSYLEKNPSIESLVRAYNNSYLTQLVRPSAEREKAFEEKGFWYVERGFLDMFDVKQVSGDFGMFDVPGTVLISESVHQKIFEGEQIIGKRILVGEDEFEVTGVYKDFPSNSSLDPRFLISVETMKSNPDYSDYFTSTGYLMFKVFMTLNEGADIDALEAQLIQQDKGGESQGEKYELEPIEDYHFSTLDIARSFGPKADEQLVVWLVIISTCLLAVAIANFGNISLAVALDRSKEVAIHKIIGARRTQLIKRSLIQSVLLSFISFICALILIEALIPIYSQFVDRELTVAIFGFRTYLILLAFTSMVGLIAGIYPALIVSSFKVSSLFNSFSRNGGSKSLIRKSLLAFQFFIAFGIISAMLFMNRQLEFMMSKEPGYDFKNTLVFQSNWFQGGDESTIQTFKDRLMAMPAIQDIALSDEHPMRALDVNDLQKPGFRDGWEKVELLSIGIDCHFFEFYGIQENYDADVISLFCGDSKVALLNETALNTLENEPIGKLLPSYYGKSKPGYLVQEGAVSDFHFNSVSEPIPAMLFMPLSYSNGRANYSIRYSENTNVGELIQTIQQMFWEYEPSEPFVLKVLEEEHKRLYSSETKMMQMMGVLGIGVCLIAFAGVFAMSIFYGRERLKEISIRKVLGAGVAQLFGLQNRVFVIAMIISIVVAVPVVIRIIDSWISQFAYRTDQPLWLFGLAGLIMLGATLLSSGWYSLKVAKSNPVDTLRDS
ncbi:FtsX-like permease family protein [Roseivirga sp.]|uniref:FtsX-like permease family protein n=1 Tax=Roseivirga sp. TaxID=1964215 RepID=UPI002B27688D|nr:FtsX-like permease family protein [Roseivirga sp.]